MTQDFTCGDPSGLVAYLYDECDGADRAAIEAHLATCAICAAELAALGATRTALASWTPQPVDLGFRITSDRHEALTDGGKVLRPARWWQRPLPAWAQAAAALVIFTAGALFGVQSGGRAQSAPPAAVTAVTAKAPAPSVAQASAADLAALERRLRSEMNAIRASDGARAVQATSTDDAVVRRVQALLAESEQRQERELALRVTQVMRDVDSQRRTDMSMIERTFGQMERVTRPELAQQREAINYLIRTASQRPPQ